MGRLIEKLREIIAREEAEADARLVRSADLRALVCTAESMDEKFDQVERQLMRTTFGGDGK